MSAKEMLFLNYLLSNTKDFKNNICPKKCSKCFKNLAVDSCVGKFSYYFH